MAFSIIKLSESECINSFHYTIFTYNALDYRISFTHTIAFCTVSLWYGNEF